MQNHSNVALVIITYCIQIISEALYYPVEVPHSEWQSSARRIVCLPLAVSVARDIQVDSILNVLLKLNNADKSFSYRSSLSIKEQNAIQDSVAVAENNPHKAASACPTFGSRDLSPN